MKRRLRLDPRARRDFKDIWTLVADKDGEERADQLVTRIQTFCLSLCDFAEVGSRHYELAAEVRSSGVPGLRSVTVLFRVTGDTVSVVAIGYLGRNVWTRLGKGGPE